jgi:hypothetical protein
MNRRELIISSVALIAGSANAALSDHVPEARRVGSGRCTVLLFPIFDAILFAPGGVWRADKPFALELAYLRPVKGAQIVEHSLKEMRHQGAKDDARLMLWADDMRRLFPDVARGARLVGVRDADGYMHLLQGDKTLGSVRDRDFTMAFFNIWLGPKSSQPELRRQLLGLSA